MHLELTGHNQLACWWEQNYVLKLERGRKPSKLANASPTPRPYTYNNVIGIFSSPTSLTKSVNDILKCSHEFMFKFRNGNHNFKLSLNIQTMLQMFELGTFSSGIYGHFQCEKHEYI